jgi:GTP-binding protein YchF
VILAITGFSNSGKTTIFNALTGLNLDTTTYPTSITPDLKPHFGMVRVPDKRLERLSVIYKPKKTTHATIEYIDYAGITSTASGGSAAHNTKVFGIIKDSDAIMHVVRVFEDTSVTHPLADINPFRDVKSFETELIFGDLELVEKRLERIESSSKTGKKHDETDIQLLLKCKKALEEEISLRNLAFTDEERRAILSYQFLSIKPEFIVLNVDEKQISSDRLKKLQEEIENYLKNIQQDTIPPVVPLCGKIEMELAQLPQEEAKAFLVDLGLEESAMHKLCRISYNSIGLISFFTVIKDEVRAWTIQKGTAALKAAGKVHSDMERGFIRAEVVHFNDFVSSEEDIVKAKAKGLVRLEGKNYTVHDGDIINFKFNV